MSSPTLLLLVDDVPIVRRVLSRLITRLDASALVIEAADVAEAQRTLANVVCNGVITDFQLPDGTGLDVLATARARDARIPVLIMSADPGVEAVALAAGATSFLSKPLDLNLTAEAIRRML